MSKRTKQEFQLINGTIVLEYPETMVFDIFINNITYKEQTYIVYEQLDIVNFSANKLHYTSGPHELYVKGVIGSSVFYFLNEKCAKKSGFRDSYKKGYYVLSSIKETELHRDPYKTFHYSSFIQNDYDNREKYGESSKTYQLTEGKQYSFGVEFETSEGVVPNYIYNDLNIKCVRDGSINGGEYVTGILTGDYGFLHLEKIVKQLSLRCKINKTCSVHVHIGGLDFSDHFIVAMYKTALLIQEEIFSLMAPSRRGNVYCQPVSMINLNNYEKYNYYIKVNEIFSSLFLLISNGHEISQTLNKNTNHPNGHHCGYRHDSTRYWWCNFVPTIFNTRNSLFNKTLEFRCHHATLNYTKVKNWILLLMGIVYYADNNYVYILDGKTTKISLEEIINYSYKNNNNYLINYIKKRKETFSNNYKEDFEYSKSQNINKPIIKLKELIRCV